MRHLSLVLLLPALVAMAHVPEQSHGPSPDSSRLKVLLAMNVPEVTVAAVGQLVFADAATGRGAGVPAAASAVVRGGRQVTLNGVPVRLPVLMLPAGGPLRFNGRRYRGVMLVTDAGKGRLHLINLVDLEEYLKGVVPREMDPRWPLEALKAQAIAARSFALNRKALNRRFRRPWDVDQTAMSQVYGGIDAEQATTTAAVSATAGFVVQYSNTVLPCFFHSTCGGHTADIGAVWGRAHPAFRGRKSEFCTNAKHYRWGAVLSRSEAGKLLGMGLPVDGAGGLILYRSGRVRSLQIRAGGRVRQFSGREFRRRLGYNRIRSTLFSVRVRGPYLQILGRGWGHGVGMCQWCAAGMARDGWPAKRILQYFYPGSRVVRRRVSVDWGGVTQTGTQKTNR